jgi:hypothetical protein
LAGWGIFWGMPLPQRLCTRTWRIHMLSRGGVARTRNQLAGIALHLCTSTTSASSTTRLQSANPPTNSPDLHRNIPQHALVVTNSPRQSASTRLCRPSTSPAVSPCTLQSRVAKSLAQCQTRNRQRFQIDPTSDSWGSEVEGRHPHNQHHTRRPTCAMPK